MLIITIQLRNLRIDFLGEIAYTINTEGVKIVKRRDLIKKLKAGGYKKDRSKDHTTYEKEGSRPVQVPNHRELDEYTAKAILKAAGLI